MSTVWSDDADFPVDHEIRDAVLGAAESLRRAGATVDEVARPDFTSRDCFETYIHLLRAATSGRQSDADFAANTAGVAKLSPEDRSYHALFLRGNVLTHRDWLAFQRRRHAMIAAWRAFFGRFDFVLCPVASTTAFKMFGDVPKYARNVSVNGQDTPSANDYFWLGLSSVAYLPATTAPVALSPSGLPIGAQIIGRLGADRACIALADILEKNHHGFAIPPSMKNG